MTNARPVLKMEAIYQPFGAPIIVTDINSAELIKHAANSFLALKISYINAVSVLCEASGANVIEVANGMGLDARIGRRFLDAGLGFGGSCFPKDLSAFIKISEQLGYDFALLKEVQRINAGQMERFVKKLTDTLWVLKDKKIGVLGLAFKQNTDDVRMSPAIDLCQRLLKEGAALRVFDPKAMEKAKAVLPPGPTITYVADMNEIATGCDALHPGYGFLAEQPRLAQVCEENGVTFVINFFLGRLANPDLARQVRDGEVKGLLLPGSKRSNLVPDVPTFAESGLSSDETKFTPWFGFFAPKGTPKEYVDTMSSEINAILAIPEFRERFLTSRGLTPAGSKPDEFAKFLLSDRKAAAELVAISGVKLNE